MTTVQQSPSSLPSANGVSEETFLQVRDLKMHFPVTEGAIVQKIVAHVKAVDGVSFDIRRGETLGLVGESGCGKTGRCILQLEHATEGEIMFEGQNLTKLSQKELVPVRAKIQVIFQDPYSSLNPRMKIGTMLEEPMRVHRIITDASKRKERVRELLSVCGLDPKFADRYPHEMSGGQRQRVGIARALALDPTFIICDEAVSALDVSIQAQVINLLEALSNFESVLGPSFCTGRYAAFANIAQKVGWIGRVVRIDPEQQTVEWPDRVNHPESRLNMPVVRRDLAAHHEIQNTPFLWSSRRGGQRARKREHHPDCRHYESLKYGLFHDLTSSFVFTSA